MMAWRITRLSEEGRLTHEQASLAKVRAAALGKGLCCQPSCPPHLRPPAP
jgi:hypothetical protein